MSSALPNAAPCKTEITVPFFSDVRRISSYLVFLCSSSQKSNHFRPMIFRGLAKTTRGLKRLLNKRSSARRQNRLGGIRLLSTIGERGSFPQQTWWTLDVGKASIKSSRSCDSRWAPPLPIWLGSWIEHNKKVGDFLGICVPRSRWIAVFSDTGRLDCKSEIALSVIGNKVFKPCNNVF